MRRKTQKFKKVFASGTVLVLYLALLTACSDGQKELSDGFDQDKTQEATTKVTGTANARDSDILREISDDTMKPTLIDDTLAVVYKAIDEGGAFQEIEEINTAGTSDKNTKEDYAVAVVRAQYEKRAFIYTISFTKDIKLAGLYYK